MKYEESKVYGDQGEAVVAQVLENACGPECRIVNDLLLDGIDTTTQIDHIFIDRFGLLLVETKFYGALLRGRSDDREWTACYAGGKTKRVQNPIRQNDKHREKLSTILQRQGYRFDKSYLQNVVVFAKGSIDHLELTDEDRARVLTTEDFAAHMATRDDFAPNLGEMTPVTVESIAELLAQLDRKHDAEVMRRHAASVNAAKGNRRGRGPKRPRPYRPSASGPRPSGRREAESFLSNLMAGVFLVVLLVAAVTWTAKTAFCWLGAPVAPSPAVYSPPASTPPPVTQVPIAQPPRTKPDVSTALAQLRGAAPDVYASITDKNSPTVTPSGAHTTFTWRYVTKTGSVSLKVGTYSLTLDDSGQIVGISRQ